MFGTRWAKGGLILFTLFFFICLLEADAFARAGGGRSFGSRGSRSYSTPSRPAPSQSAPSYSQTQRPPMSQPAPFQQPGGFLRSMAGGIVGGMIGGMLFRSLGFAGGGMGMGGDGIGLMDIVLIGLILFGIYWFIKKRRQQAAAGASYQSGVEPIQPGTSYSSSHQPAYGEPDQGSEVERGIGHIRQMDPSFDEKKFGDACMDIFFRIQGAWMNRDMSSVKGLLTDEMYGLMQSDVEKLRAEKRINRLENIAVRSVDISEAWQESGYDFITAKIYANLLDYTTDDAGQVVSGSKTDPVKFEEYWTLTRTVGSNDWRLSAITQAQ